MEEAQKKVIIRLIVTEHLKISCHVILLLYFVK